MSFETVTTTAAPLEPPRNWPSTPRQEFRERQFSGCIGHLLVSESARVRVWSLRLRPGERLPFHRHVLDYFWTATTPGKARSRYSDGRTSEPEYETGDTMHFTFSSGEFMVHDLENIGNEISALRRSSFSTAPIRRLKFRRPYDDANARNTR